MFSWACWSSFAGVTLTIADRGESKVMLIRINNRFFILSFHHPSAFWSMSNKYFVLFSLYHLRLVLIFVLEYFICSIYLDLPACLREDTWRKSPSTSWFMWYGLSSQTHNVSFYQLTMYCMQPEVLAGLCPPKPSLPPNCWVILIHFLFSHTLNACVKRWKRSVYQTVSQGLSYVIAALVTFPTCCHVILQCFMRKGGVRYFP